MTKKELLAKAKERAVLCAEIKEMIVDQLKLDIPPKAITDDQSLFGRGLELDSIDALEIAAGMDAKFGVTITDENIGVFGSVNTLADFIEEQRKIEAEQGEVWEDRQRGLQQSHNPDAQRHSADEDETLHNNTTPLYTGGDDPIIDLRGNDDAPDKG